MVGMNYTFFELIAGEDLEPGDVVYIAPNQRGYRVWKPPVETSDDTALECWAEDTVME